MVTLPDYQMMELMGGSSGQSRNSLIRNGVALEAIDNLSRYGINAMSARIINPRTLRNRRAKGARLSPDEGDRLYRVSVACCSGAIMNSPTSAANSS